jgi:peroxiredoxin
MLRRLAVPALAAVLFAAPSLTPPNAPPAVPSLASALAADAPVEVGTEAPDFKLKDQDGKEVQLSTYRGKKNVVVAFYPKAFSPGCTREMKCISTEWKKLEERGAEVLAVSGDPVEKLKEFAASVGSRHPMLSDGDFAVAKRWGVYTPSPEGGFAARSVFVVDREGKVRWMIRDFVVPKTLEGTEFLKQLDLLKPAGGDPADQFASLASPEKEAKVLLVRYVQALLAEDSRAVDALLHPDFGWNPKHTPAMIQQKRAAELERVRKLFDANDLKSVAFGDVLDPRDAKTAVKGDQEKPGCLAGFSEDLKKAVADLPEGDLLLVARTKALKIGEQALLAREIQVFLRKDGTAWKILNIAGR